MMEVMSLLPKSPKNPSSPNLNYIENNGDEESPTTMVKRGCGVSVVDHHGEEKKKKKKKMSKYYWILLSINYISMFLGSISSSLLSRFYFIHGGSSVWISTWVQSAGFPLLLLPIYLPHLFNFNQRKPFSHFTPKLLLISLFIGLMIGINNFLFSWGISYLSVSTSSLLLSSQLAFNLLLSVILVKQKITFSNLNCVILLTTSSVLLALSSSHDRPEGVSRAHYFMGFFSILGAGFLFALYLPLVEMIYRKVHCYQMIMEMQLIMESAALVLATIGMMISSGFGEVRREAQSGFDLGSFRYGLTIGLNVVSWQLCFMGTAGMVFLTTSLTGGICMTALLPMNVLGGVLVYGDEFGGVKIVSTVLCVWGFCSYVYGEKKKIKEKKLMEEKEMFIEKEEEEEREIVGVDQIVRESGGV